MNTEATPEVHSSSDLSAPSLAEVRTSRAGSRMSKAAKTGEAWEKVPRRALDLLHELTGNEAKLWLAYRLNQFGQDKNCHPGNQRLRRQTGLSVNTVTSARQRLFEKGWLWFMGYHRRSDGTFSGRTLECRAVVPEGSPDSRIFKAPTKVQQRPDRRDVGRGKNGRFVPKIAGTDDGPRSTTDAPPTTVFSPLTDSGFPTVTDNGPAPSQNRPFDEDTFLQTAKKELAAMRLASSSSSSVVTLKDEEDESIQPAVVVGDSVSSKPDSPKPKAESPAKRAGSRLLTDEEVLAELDNRFKFLTRCRPDRPDGYSLLKGATDRERRYIIGKAREKKRLGMHYMLSAFANDGHNWDSIDCPIAVLRSRWTEYENQTPDDQNPDLWTPVAGAIERAFNVKLSEKQIGQVKAMVRVFGFMQTLDAFWEYMQGKPKPSGADAFLENPHRYFLFWF